MVKQNYAMQEPTFSIIVPVYNRPQEVSELLNSLCLQTEKDFEVIIVEDGSTIDCKDICETYQQLGDFVVKYYLKDNSGPGPSRNYGAAKASGEYLLILDSDVIVPADYIKNISNHLEKEPLDAFGGPDCAHEGFSDIQKAISYAMTSFFTTGGIRGGKKKMDKFYPRSFNLGVRKEVFNTLNGFSAMRFGEDIDFSIRVYGGGYSCDLIPEAWVWHKRRATFKQFFKQVHNSGIARIALYQKYPYSLKLVHLLPTLFTLGVSALVVLSIIGLVLGIKPLIFCPLLLIVLYSTLLCIDATTQNKSLKVGFLSIIAGFVQLIGYGTGFLRAIWHSLILKQTDFQAFRKNFYK